MNRSLARFPRRASHGAWFILAALAACGGDSTPDSPAATPAAATPAAPATTAGQGTVPPGQAPATATPEPSAADLAAATTEASQTLQADATTWSPESLEDLLAPVALYPDPVLMQLLVAVTNPQEVLDAGNWLIANPDVSGKAQEQAAEKAGFTLPVRAVMQFPEVVDQLCLNMPWSEELGQAYVNDQKGVMDAVQRLRAQAEDVGNLKSSPQMKVETSKPTPSEPEIITISPPATQVVYVPQYDPQAVYAPPGAAPAAAPATTTTTTTTTTDEDKGHSTGSMVATGLLAFGAGMLVNEVFDDDDDWNNSGYYGPMWRGPMPYYPPAPYRPVYGGGFYPSNGYARPNNYVRGGNTVIVNQNNNYFNNRYDNPGNAARTRNSPRSPITAARPGRSDLQQLNTQAARGPARKAPAASEAWKGKSGYAGNDPKVRQSLDKQAANAQRTQANRPVSRDTPKVAGKPAAPKVQGGYAGAKPARDTASAGAARTARDQQSRPQSAQARPDRQQQQRPTGLQQNRPATAQTRPANSNAGGGVGGIGTGADRGRPESAGTASRPAPRHDSSSRSSGALGQSGQSGLSANQSSQRGKQSLPAGHAAKPHGGGRRR